MRRRAALLVLLAGSEAAALTCLPPDPLQSFGRAEQAEEAYVVLLGRLDFDPARLTAGEPPSPGATETRREPVPARFEGMGLGPDGFTRPVAAGVLLEPLCLGQFCGTIGPGDDWLLFARPDGAGGYRVEIDPCGSWAFDSTGPEIREALAACLGGQATCGEADRP